MARRSEARRAVSRRPTALAAEVDVDERDVGLEGQRLVDGRVRCPCEADDRDPVVRKKLRGGFEELRAVVDDQAGEWRVHACPGSLPPRLRRQTDNGRLSARHPAPPSTGLRVDGVDTAVCPNGSAHQRVAIADDDVLLRQGLAALLRECGYDVVGQARDADGLIELVRNEEPDIAIVDIRMPPTHTTEGLVAARTIRDELPRVAILVLSAHIEVEHAMDLLGAGRGIGYLLKSRVGDVDELRDTLERISSGGSVVDPALVEELVRARRARDPLEALTARERDVLALMAEGRSNTGIARSLWIAEGTVEKHVRSIFQKLRLPDAPDDHRRVLAVIAFLGSQ